MRNMNSLESAFRKLAEAYDIVVACDDVNAAETINRAYRDISRGCEPKTHVWGSGPYCYCGLKQWRP